jgi:hypothetical protein
MPPQTLQTKQVTLLILSDTHSFHHDFATLTTLATSYPPIDILLHCGDLTNVSAPSELSHALHFLSLIPATLKLVIAGNHDLTLDHTYCSTPNARVLTLQDHDAARAMWIGPTSLAARTGITYLEEGTHTFALASGARFTVHASPFQPTCGDWAFGYPWSFDRWTAPSASFIGRAFDYLWGRTDRVNPPHVAENPIPGFPRVDVLMTHGPPRGVLDRTRLGDERGCVFLRRAVGKVRPRVHCFGHMHEGRGVARIAWKRWWVPFASEKVEVLGERKAEEHDAAAVEVLDLTDEGGRGVRHGRETVFVNAAIRDGGNRIANRPWVVKMDLPIGDVEE